MPTLETFKKSGQSSPLNFWEKEQAISIALKQLGNSKPSKVTAQLVFPPEEEIYNRYFPIWKITADERTIGMLNDGRIRLNIS